MGEIMSVQFIEYQGETRSLGPELFKGAVLDTYEANGYDDSDWYAIVWDAEKETVHTVMYDTTRAAAMGRADVDATPDAIEKAYDFAFRVKFESEIKDFKIVAPGKHVKSLTKKGKAVGAVGTVERFENSKFDSAWSARYSPTKVAVVKVTDTGSMHCGRNLYVAPDKLEVTDELTPDTENDLRQETFLAVRGSSFLSLFHNRYGSLFQPSELYR
jgi:hypothetical protein